MSLLCPAPRAYCWVSSTLAPGAYGCSKVFQPSDATTTLGQPLSAFYFLSAATSDGHALEVSPYPSLAQEHKCTAIWAALSCFALQGACGHSFKHDTICRTRRVMSAGAVAFTLVNSSMALDTPLVSLSSSSGPVAVPDDSVVQRQKASFRVYPLAGKPFIANYFT